MVSDAERLARAALARLGEPGDLVLARFVNEHGAEATLEAIVSGHFPGRALDDYQTRLAANDPERDLAVADRAGARLVCPGDPEWPESLDLLATAGAVDQRGGPPLALWVRGTADLRQVTLRSCAVVGARAASQYGLYVAAELSSGLADRDVVVVSGGAFGIDASAHRGALAAGGQTVAVLASGVDVPYPRAHEQLFRWIAEDGLVVSEAPPGSTPRRPRFLIRNRLIAALTLGTVVVEAALRSGALNTAAWAERCHREVMGVPGPVTSTTSAGVHRMVREGAAVLVTDADEIVEHIGRIGEDLAPRKAGEERSRDALDPRSRQVLEAVPVLRAGGVARIAEVAGVAADDVLGILGHLLLLGYVERQGNGWRLSPEERARRRHASTAARGG
ncbi:DNA-processing protein DprA [Actinopolymorpha alba]|uniref:DNA-processing protein DprA n=1 Tax=Actinopolymorpha alba TaxID=533267 RepID=UPI00036A1A12|nr:DNA-processing protein DprA [Actinopolymorpha alba]